MPSYMAYGGTRGTTTPGPVEWYNGSMTPKWAASGSQGPKKRTPPVEPPILPTPSRVPQSIENSRQLQKPAYPDTHGHEVTQVELWAAELYGQGKTRSQTAKILLNYLCPRSGGRAANNEPMEQRLKNARLKLKRWEGEEWFRDILYDIAIIQTDLELPAVMRGVVRKARAGRVDAARLALEVTGRHTGKTDQVPTNIVLSFGSDMPRPQQVEHETIDGEVVEEDG